jgi:NADPH-dependent 2,4-dienoyl-CoA reductase/sulfur reductase-like enzyme
VKRREFLGALVPIIGAPAIIGLTRKAPRAVAGGFVDDGGALGHTLRDGTARASGESRRVPVVIVGGGMAGLSAGWQLDRRGFHDFVILELEKSAGGNSRWGENDITAYPWAAHYVPVPNREATFVRELFQELGVMHAGEWDERAEKLPALHLLIFSNSAE